MNHGFIKKASRRIIMLLGILCRVHSLAAQDVPAAALKAGFSKVAGKTLGTFEVPSLSGTSISSVAATEIPVLYHVWSTTKDPSAEGPSLAAALSKAVPGAHIYVLTQDAASKIQGGIKKSGLDTASAAAGAGNAIRALGGPSAPAWIFVAPGGRILAYRLGRLDPEGALDAVESLFSAYPPASSTVKTEPARTESPVLPNTGFDDTSFAAPIELAVVAELNLARTQPAAYIDILKEYKSHIKGNYLERPGEITVVLNEGAKAVDLAIAFLQKQKPIPPLTLSKGLSLAARDHAKDQGKTGQTGHTGSDKSTMGQRIERYGQWESTAGENIAYGGETARDVVIQLIVDDGVPSRGHRTNIFNEKFLVVGIAFGTHPGYRTVCVQDFAGGYKER